MAHYPHLLSCLSLEVFTVSGREVMSGRGLLRPLTQWVTKSRWLKRSSVPLLTQAERPLLTPSNKFVLDSLACSLFNKLKYQRRFPRATKSTVGNCFQRGRENKVSKPKRITPFKFHRVFESGRRVCVWILEALSLQWWESSQRPEGHWGPVQLWRVAVESQGLLMVFCQMYWPWLWRAGLRQGLEYQMWSETRWRSRQQCMPWGWAEQRRNSSMLGNAQPLSWIINVCYKFFSYNGYLAQLIRNIIIL